MTVCLRLLRRCKRFEENLHSHTDDSYSTTAWGKFSPLKSSNKSRRIDSIDLQMRLFSPTAESYECSNITGPTDRFG